MKRKLLIAAAVLVFAFGVLEMVSPSTPSEPNGTQLAGQTTASSPQDPPSEMLVPSTPPVTAVAEEPAPEAQEQTPARPAMPEVPQTDDVQAARAAAEAQRVISEAPLMHEAAMPAALKAVVVPANLKILTQVLPLAAPGMAAWYGYPSVADAKSRAGYHVVPEMFKVLDFGGGNATISVFSIEYLKTGDHPLDERMEPNREYGFHQIMVVLMRKVNGKWLYISNRQPKPSEAPAPVNGLPFEAMERRFQPYLEGYVNL